MRIDVPSQALLAGFLNEPVGTHTSRTIMLPELTLLFEATDPRAAYGDYQQAAVPLNVLGKSSDSTRQKTFRHLRELYALKPSVAVFAAMREL